MPTVFRSMKRDPNDGLPLRGQSATTLGVRASDFDIDQPTTLVVKNEKGISVSPSCGQLPQPLRPRRFPGGLGGNNLCCFKLGDGLWQQAVVAPGLELLPDGPVNPDHGVLRPETSMKLIDLENAIEATRANWQVV